MSDDFGTLLAALRTSKVVTCYRANGSRRWPVETIMSQNELARRVGVDPAYINRLERGLGQPSAPVVERLSAALEAARAARARFIVAAGYWPWPAVDGEQLDVLLGCALAIADGDYRLLDEAPPVPLETGARLEAR